MPCPYGERKKAYPPPRVFLGKSSELLEKKGVEICADAKEFVRV
jgi:hypothetical protein